MAPQTPPRSKNRRPGKFKKSTPRKNLIRRVPVPQLLPGPSCCANEDTQRATPPSTPPRPRRLSQQPCPASALKRYGMYCGNLDVSAEEPSPDDFSTDTDSLRAPLPATSPRCGPPMPDGAWCDSGSDSASLPSRPAMEMDRHAIMRRLSERDTPSTDVHRARPAPSPYPPPPLTRRQKWLVLRHVSRAVLRAHGRALAAGTLSLGVLRERAFVDAFGRALAVGHRDKAVWFAHRCAHFADPLSPAKGCDANGAPCFLQLHECVRVTPQAFEDVPTCVLRLWGFYKYVRMD